VAKQTGKPDSLQPVSFTRAAANRIAKTVSRVEGEARKTEPLRFGPRQRPRPGVVGDIFRTARFTGSWSVDSTATVEFTNSTFTPQTATANQPFLRIATGDVGVAKDVDNTLVSDLRGRWQRPRLFCAATAPGCVASVRLRRRKAQLTAKRRDSHSRGSASFRNATARLASSTVPCRTCCRQQRAQVHDLWLEASVAGGITDDDCCTHAVSITTCSCASPVCWSHSIIRTRYWSQEASINRLLLAADPCRICYCLAVQLLSRCADGQCRAFCEELPP
jgi:hypothetical protein